MSTYEKIRTLRKKRSLTQKALGELCGISEAMIRRYELGIRNPKIETLKKIATALDVPVDYLLDEKINIKLSVEDSIIKLLGINEYEMLKELSRDINVSIPKLIGFGLIQGIEDLRAKMKGEERNIIIDEIREYQDKLNFEENEMMSDAKENEHKNKQQ